LFTRFEASKGRPYQLRAGSRVFEPEKPEAVIGSIVARRLGLVVGSTFHPFHGVIYDESAQHSEVYTVVGVLEPTNTPSDRVLWIPIDGVFRMSGHVLRGTGSEYVAQE